MFDQDFFRTVLPDLVTDKCRRQPDRTPVVELKLGDGTVLDVCHIGPLQEKWLALAIYRDPRTCEEMDYAFLPYELVLRVTVSLHPSTHRKLGFQVVPRGTSGGPDVLESAGRPQGGPTAPIPQPKTGL